MKKEILQYLNSFNDDEYHELNKFLTTNFNTEPLVVVRKNFTFLQNFKLIEVKDELNHNVGLPTPTTNTTENISKIENLDTILIKARIAAKGRKICEEIKNTPKPPQIKFAKNNRLKKYLLKPALLIATVVLLWKFINKLLHYKNKK